MLTDGTRTREKSFLEGLRRDAERHTKLEAFIFGLVAAIAATIMTMLTLLVISLAGVVVPTLIGIGIMTAIGLAAFAFVGGGILMAKSSPINPDHASALEGPTIVPDNSLTGTVLANIQEPRMNHEMPSGDNASISSARHVAFFTPIESEQGCAELKGTTSSPRL